MTKRAPGSGHQFKEHSIQSTVFPVFVPNENNELKLEVAKASLNQGRLVVSFNDRLPAQAIQRMIASGTLMCLTVVPVTMVETEEPNTEATEADNKENN